MSRLATDAAPLRFDLAPSGRAARTLDEQIVARIPVLFRLGTALVLALPQGSRLRRGLISHFTVRTMDCFTRCDPELLVTRCASQCEVHVMQAPAELALDEAYRGHEGVRELLASFHARRPGARWIPTERIELPDGRFLHLSNIETDSSQPLPFAQLLQFHRGAMVREQLWIGETTEPFVAAGLASPS